MFEPYGLSPSLVRSEEQVYKLLLKVFALVNWGAAHHSKHYVNKLLHINFLPGVLVELFRDHKKLC